MRAAVEGRSATEGAEGRADTAALFGANGEEGLAFPIDHDAAPCQTRGGNDNLGGFYFDTFMGRFIAYPNNRCRPTFAPLRFQI